MSGTTPQGGFWNNWKNSAIPAQGGTISTPNASGTNVGYRGTAGTGIAADPFVADLLAISDADRLVISKLLVDAGYLKKATSKYNKKLGDAWSLANMEYATEKARTGRPDLSVRQFLLENAGAGSDGTKKPNLPTRQIYDVPKAQIESDVNEAAQKILGRTINDEDKGQDWYQDLVKGINKLYQKGTVTTSKEVVNPATGKKEKQVIQKPGFSREKIATQIEETLAAESPVDVQRKQRVDFTKWLFSQMGGQG
jgi:hypothetical protein